MLFQNKVIIPETHRGLLFKDEQFVAVLDAGVHTFWDWKTQYRVQQIAVTGQAQTTVPEDVLTLAELHPDKFAAHLHCWETGEQEVGLLYQGNVLKDIKPPAQRGACWQGQRCIEVRKLDISTDFKVPKALANQLLAVKEPALRAATLNALAIAAIPEGHTGFLEVDGEQREVLAAGTHAWWQFNHSIKVTQLDCRLQNMEVNGQEILTKDRVGLRINLSAMWQIVDPQQVKTALADHQDYLYRELQLALRTVVSTQTLDELLADKNLLNQTIQQLVAEKAAAYGIVLKAVGARDIVLPGDMKAILAQVVAAEKQAEASLIRRREETQETRSLHNTAKVMEGNPVLLRLKELEVLEKITARISTLNVYGGLDGVMNDLVKLTDKTKAA
ncbi:slipin family protein [Candidatus Thiothrix sp. Deng01]|uniref:Slipin family protein n=1 Tax=Candidatus Thiothrix phosphatis TaxID=3112415 RepID=A0ABU6D372_9GAMM|nr:slipin family protein [Candidatus Thiothrix sp. Deng01]MEB4593123.1 slipin family protein [Candidatus Thiothrix sp. Deng01]